MRPYFVVGVDLGQAHDYTAIAVTQLGQCDTGRETTRVTNYLDVNAHAQPLLENTYDVRHLERMPLGTPYPQQVERVRRIVTELRDRPDVIFQEGIVRLVVDQTGVGRPVVDMLRQAGLRDLIAVSIHGGDATTRAGREHRVPKRELVSVMQVLLQTDRLRVAASLPEAQTLTREMLAFKVTFNATGHDTYGNDWRENPHDDMVLAVALSTWAGERTWAPRPAGELRRASGLPA